MLHAFAGPKRLVLVLLFLTAVPIIAAMMRVAQIPLGTLPEMAHHLQNTPYAHFLHTLAGVSFGLIGPLQFAGVLKRKFGRAHRVMGRIYVAAGAILALSSLRLLATHLLGSTPLLDIERALAGLALGAALWIALRAAMRRDITRHKAWMIRSYAVGMGSSTIVFVYFPYYLIMGEDPSPLAGDLLFLLSWVVNIGIGEWIIRKTSPTRRNV